MRPERSTRPNLRVRPGMMIVLVAVVVLAPGIAVTAGLWSDPAGRMISGNIPDAIHYSWWLGHTPQALSLGQSPFYTFAMNWSEGVSAMNNTTLLLPAVLLWPVTALADSLVTLNLLNVLAVPACTAAGYWALRQVPWEPQQISRPAALIGGVAFGISPAIVNSLVGHITMAFAPALPVLVALSIKAWHGDRPVRTGLLLGAVATVQVFTGEEVLFQAGVAALVILLVAAISRPRAIPAAGSRLARSLAVAFAVFLPIAGYPLYLQFFSPLKQHGSPFLLDYYGADITAFTTPTSQLLLHSTAAAEKSVKFAGGIEEHLAYLGWPLLIVCLLITVICWRLVAVRCAGVALAVAAALSLGGRLWINGTWTEYPGPYRLLQALPVTEASLATRLGLLTAMFAGALLAFAVHEVRTRAPRPALGALLAAGLSLVCLVPLIPLRLPVVTAAAIPEWFSTTARELPAESVVVVLPYPVPVNPVAMRWQSAADYRFRMPGGYFLGPGPDGQAYVSGAADPLTANLLSQVAETGQPAVVTPEQQAQADADLAAWGADQIVLGPHPAQAALRETMTNLIGQQPQLVDGVYLWTNPVTG